MGLPKGERVVRLLKSVYGLTTAPLEWYQQVDRVLKKLGGVQAASDPCIWTFNSADGVHLGLIGAHVDDFLIGGEKCAEWDNIISTLLTAFRWTPWESGHFKQCGVHVEQLPNGDIESTKKSICLL